MKLLYGLDLYDHGSINPKIEAISDIQVHLTIDQGKGHLSFYAEAHCDEFVRQTGFISVLQKARSKEAMDLKSSVHDPIGYLVLMH